MRNTALTLDPVQSKACPCVAYPMYEASSVHGPLGRAI